MMHLLMAAGEGPTLWTFFGRFHPATVHFPIAMILVAKARAAQGRIVQVARASLVLGLIMVSITGHWGGELVYGDSYYVSGMPIWLRRILGREDAPAKPLPVPTADKVDFVKEI